MRISKTLVAFCAIALCAALVGNAAPDNEAQAKAREALRKKLAEEGQTVPETPAIAPAAPSAPASPISSEPGQEDKLREALRQKIQELNQQEPAGVTTAPAAVTPAPAVTPSPVAAPAPIVVTLPPAAPVAPSPAFGPVVPSGDVEHLRQAMRRKIQELNEPSVAETTQTPAAAAQTSKTSDEQAELMRQRVRETIAEEQAREQAARSAAAAQPTVTEPPTEASPQPGATGFKPIVAPPSALSGSKEARLAELTRRYKADQITPEEYHTERAKLIAEP